MRIIYSLCEKILLLRRDSVTGSYLVKGGSILLSVNILIRVNYTPFTNFMYKSRKGMKSYDLT